MSELILRAAAEQSSDAPEVLAQAYLDDRYERLDYMIQDLQQESEEMTGDYEDYRPPVWVPYEVRLSNGTSSFSDEPEEPRKSYVLSDHEQAAVGVLQQQMEDLYDRQDQLEGIKELVSGGNNELIDILAEAETARQAAERQHRIEQANTVPISERDFEIYRRYYRYQATTTAGQIERLEADPKFRDGPLPGSRSGDLGKTLLGEMRRTVEGAHGAVAWLQKTIAEDGFADNINLRFTITNIRDHAGYYHPQLLEGLDDLV